MLYKLGRGLQFLGLVILPVAMAGNLARPTEFGLWYTLSLSGVGILFFTLGWLLQQKARPE
ncbi:MAG: hypothetical protein K2R98_16145 [Gemmataceae bacterium]|nr:hypothetical protein [Gemmataceae bacterium]